MSAARVLVLPVVWATAETTEATTRRVLRPVEPEMAFYRKYTEALLRRYNKLSMEKGRTPSLLGQDLFRGRVTHYKVRGFDDVVIFVHDVEQSLKLLAADELNLVRRIAIQEYTQVEVAQRMRMPTRTLVRRYERALDALTRILLERRILEPLAGCQGTEAP